MKLLIFHKSMVLMSIFKMKTNVSHLIEQHYKTLTSVIIYIISLLVSFNGPDITYKLLPQNITVLQVNLICYRHRKNKL